MAKDPAILWYFDHWSGGTVGFNRHMKGCYMDLLNAQFNIGPLSLEEIKNVLGNDFAVWGVLSKKFQKNPEGLFFNEKMESEKLKRKNFVLSRNNNPEGKNKPPEKNGHTGGHMTPLPVNVNVNVNGDVKKNENVIVEVAQKIDLKKEIYEGVRVTHEEDLKLRTLFGTAYAWALETLSNYKLSKGKTYKSDYHALVGWVKNKYHEQLTKQQTSGAGNLTASDIRMAEWLRNNSNSKDGSLSQFQ